jgi:hypothetical protein
MFRLRSHAQGKDAEGVMTLGSFNPKSRPRYQGSQADKGQGMRSEDRTVEREILDVFHRSVAETLNPKP